ncbi:MAG TPA: hypothetical protein VFV86_08415 [Nitrososphaeraceae archaeon]|nr:hypothetical protein [Nitrososphaeraceae archaeon]
MISLLKILSEIKISSPNSRDLAIFEAKKLFQELKEKGEFNIDDLEDSISYHPNISYNIKYSHLYNYLKLNDELRINVENYEWITPVFYIHDNKITFEILF